MTVRQKVSAVLAVFSETTQANRSAAAVNASARAQAFRVSKGYVRAGGLEGGSDLVEQRYRARLPKPGSGGVGSLTEMRCGTGKILIAGPAVDLGSEKRSTPAGWWRGLASHAD